MWKRKKSSIQHFHVFGSVCYILNDIDYMHKLDPKSDEWIFLGYYTTSCAYKFYNDRTHSFIEFINLSVKDV